MVCELVPAHTNERAVAETVLAALWHGEVCGDKGFLGADWQQTQRETQGNCIILKYLLRRFFGIDVQTSCVIPQQPYLVIPREFMDKDVVSGTQSPGRNDGFGG